MEENVHQTPAHGTETDIGQSSFNNPISVKHWLLNLLVLAIPLVGLIMLIIWAIGGDNISIQKQNIARAYLLYTAIVFVLLIIFYALIFAVIFTALA